MNQQGSYGFLHGARRFCPVQQATPGPCAGPVCRARGPTHVQVRVPCRALKSLEAETSLRPGPVLQSPAERQAPSRASYRAWWFGPSLPDSCPPQVAAMASWHMGFLWARIDSGSGVLFRPMGYEGKWARDSGKWVPWSSEGVQSTLLLLFSPSGPRG